MAFGIEKQRAARGGMAAFRQMRGAGAETHCALTLGPSQPGTAAQGALQP